jgi:hypothetical protein
VSTPCWALWNGSAQMEEWTAAVSQGAVTSVADNIVTVHTTYFCGSVTAIRTGDGQYEATFRENDVDAELSCPGTLVGA